MATKVFNRSNFRVKGIVNDYTFSLEPGTGIEFKDVENGPTSDEQVQAFVATCVPAVEPALEVS